MRLRVSGPLYQQNPSMDQEKLEKRGAVTRLSLPYSKEITIMTSEIALLQASLAFAIITHLHALSSNITYYFLHFTLVLIVSLLGFVTLPVIHRG